MGKAGASMPVVLQIRTPDEVLQIRLACPGWEAALAVTEEVNRAGSTLLIKVGPEERIPLGKHSWQAAVASAVAASADSGTPPLLNLDIKQTEPLLPMPAEATVSLTLQPVANHEPTKLPLTIRGTDLATADPKVFPLLRQDKTPLSDDLPSTAVEEQRSFFIGEVESFFIGEEDTPQSATSSLFSFSGESDALQSATSLESVEAIQLDCEIATAARAVKAAWAEYLRSSVQVFSAVLHFQAVLGAGATHAVLATTRAASGVLTACAWKAAGTAWGAASNAAHASKATYVQAARELGLRVARAAESIREHAAHAAQAARMHAVQVVSAVHGGVSEVVHFSPAALSGGRHRFFRSVFVGDVRLVDAEVELAECLVTGSMSLEGSSRLAVSNSLLTGAVALEGCSALVLCGGLLTGQVSCSAASALKNRGGIILSAVQYPAP